MRWPAAPAILACLALVACGEPSELEGLRSAGRHPEGWATASGHGAWLEARNYPLEACNDCHSPTTGEGACNGCHEQGVDDCATCHAEPGGAHTAHTRFDCATCHEVPGSLASPGHLEDRGDGDVRFTGLALARGAAPSFDAQTGGCSDTACHAGPGATVPVPRWRDPAVQCGDCHATPPADHPIDRCDRCHGDVVDAAGAIINPALHANGVINARDWLGFGCGECHGAGDDPWPTTGAHPAHKQPADAQPVACGTCHTLPATAEAPGHVLQDATPDAAEVVLSPRAGDSAAFASGRCSDTTCHGPTRPRWGDSLITCDGCHSVPPANHPPGDCARCHPTAAPDQRIAVPEDHVDGRLDVDHLAPDSCDDCHVNGQAVPAGAHAGHARFACGECHTAPNPAQLADHLDGDPVIALRRGGAYAGTTCSDSGCHLAGQPSWADPTTVDGCGACHGEPPANHPAGACVQCHPLGDDTHVDGQVQVILPAGCDGCHGDPPESGAHLAHANTQAFAPVGCDACHTVPATVEAPGHLDAPPAEGFRPEPTWAGDPLAGSCGACHGVPPADHPPGNCAQCHGAVIDAQGAIIAPGLHANGRVDFR